MGRLIDADALFINLDGMMAVSPTGYIHGETVADMISDAPTVDAVPVIRCKDCKHRPKVNGECEDGYDIEFPNFMKCPCECEDGWYNWMPKDDWYCANAERKEE